MPKISVIVPVYKVEEYLDRCVESILAQTFTDFELILVDDGSPDNCPAMCDEWATKDKRIRVIHKDNEGVSIARNMAVSIAKGQFVTFVDSDDAITQEYLTILWNGITKHNADICVATKIDIDSKTRPTTGISQTFDNCEAIRQYGFINDERFRAPWAKLIKKEIVLKHPFPTDRSYSEDMAIVYKWYFSANIIVDIQSQVYYYTINEEGVTLQKYGLHRLGNLKTLHEMLEFLRDNCLFDLHKLKLDEYLYQLFWQSKELIKINRTDISNKLITEIKNRLRNEESATISEYPQYYNYVYPKRMKWYWTFKGISLKIKNCFRSFSK